MNRSTIEQPPPAIAPLPSPIEVEYPEYPGAPLVQAAAAAMPAPLEATASAPLTVNRERSEAPHRPVPVPLVEPEAAHAFDVRSPIPQAAASVSAAVAIAGEETPPPSDSPPRRIGPPIVVATLGGSTSQQGRVVLVLEVTEQGDVARIVSREGVDVHPDVIDSVVAAARSWRYAPARRDGVAVPARVRVVVQLNGANN